MLRPKLGTSVQFLQLKRSMENGILLTGILLVFKVGDDIYIYIHKYNIYIIYIIIHIFPTVWLVILEMVVVD